MRHDATAIAKAFHEIIATGDSGTLVDERGEPAVATVPMTGGAAASLVWNAALGHFVVTVARPVSHMKRAAADTLAEALADLTTRTRFGSALVGGMTSDGHLSVSSVINGTTGEAAIATLLSNSLALLMRDASAGDQAQEAEGRAGTLAESLVSDGWIRV